jgi:8-oxo-dGTP diphosphatase
MNLVGYVLAYIVKDNQVLMLYRSNTGFANNCYGLPGGKIEPHESAQQALIREMQEELGITVNAQDTQLMHVMSFKGASDADSLVLLFSITKWLGKLINKESHKHDHIAWFSLDSLPTNIIPRHKHMLNYSIQKQFYSQEGYNRYEL